jgi:hypothetical protein
MVKIIPKAAPKTPLWQQILLWISVLLIVFAVIGYFVIDHFYKQKVNEVSAIEDEINLVKDSEGVELRKELFDKQNKINDFKRLLEDHSAYSNLFVFLGDMCHPKVQFEGLNFNKGEEGYNLEIPASAESYEVLHQQIMFLREKEMVNQMEISEISISKEGAISFKLSFSLDPKVLKFE